MSEEFWWKKAGIFYALASKSHFVKNVRSAFLKRVDTLNLSKRSKVLDAGCGDGNITFPLAKRGFNVTAIDFGDAVLKQGRKKQEEKSINNIRFEFGDLNKPLRYEDNLFDLVTSLHVIMKVKRAKFALSEFYRVLKPEGYLFISLTSSSETFVSWFKRYVKEHGLFKSLWDIRWIIIWGIPYTLLTKKSERREEWRWPPEELKRYTEETGFKTVLVEEVPYIHVGCALGVFKK